MQPRGTIPNRQKTEPVHESRAMLTQCAPVIGSRVAFVGGEIVLRKNLVPLIEAGIAVDLGKNGSRRNGPAARVTVDQGQLLDRQVEGKRIDEQVIRLNVKRSDGPTHREPSGLIDVDLIDLVDVGG